VKVRAVIRLIEADGWRLNVAPAVTGSSAT
jgi:hypothetical protein